MTKKCCFCGKEIKGWGNNPNGAMFQTDEGVVLPMVYREGDECCDECNSKYVIPGRLYQMIQNKQNK
jgi:hypothetical protein